MEVTDSSLPGIHVRGYCPMGCGERLYLDPGTRQIRCAGKNSAAPCRSSVAVHRILADPDNAIAVAIAMALRSGRESTGP